MPTFIDEVEVPDDASTIDVAPDVSDVEYPCTVCGAEAGPYGGRGRKPTKCAIHKKTTNNSSARAPKVSGSNAVLAAQATEALASIDGILELTTRLIGFTDTADAISDADEVFRIRCNAALLNSPDTARKILRYGGKAGDAGLMIAIGLHLATILPVLMGEAKAKKAEREAKAAEATE